MRLLTDQSQAAGNDHDDDESLKVLVFHQLKHVTTKRPPETANDGIVDCLTALAFLVTAGRKTLIRVSHKHYIHLQGWMQEVCTGMYYEHRFSI